MKRIELIIFSVIMVFVMVGCTSKNVKAPTLPGQDKIKGIEIKTSKTKNGVIINKGTAFKKILGLIDDALKEGNGKGSKSVSDVPVNIKEYFTVSIVSNDDHTDRFYFYKENGRAYIEYPYSGIWEISDELYNKVMKFIG